MPIDKQLLRQLLATEKYKKCADTPDSAAALASTLSDTDALVQSCQNVQAIPFILWNDFYNADGILSPKSKKKAYRYKWGDKVFVDFGCGNIQTELSFPHPAIVLYNFANTVIVAPTTSDDSLNCFSDDIEEVIIKAKKDGTVFPKDTIINLHQIKSVHKDRIISNLRCNVKSYIVDKDEIARQNAIHGEDTFIDGMDLLDCIRAKLVYIFAEPQMQAKNAEIFQQRQKIEKMQADLEAAQQKILELTTQAEKASASEQEQKDRTPHIISSDRH